ncbi:hypothetical protein BCR32DRAFT_242274 [Anaeromyces robustus]|uniref:Trimeric LpxA-like protein n=1 Tax=Anaeromyces robustus TaxID=1754192 RepID=A0A1Y1XGD5_9FUNG|nr:hypothetical protein BCR32DRAFT_242274 [Anaeromyces robustus]|eukprot:ORX84820.1 hypothetical protein BCR32DRAFT_242274 [Anaeromyces robustus]
MSDIYERDLKGELVSSNDPGYDKLIADIFATIRKATEMNTGYLTIEEDCFIQQCCTFFGRCGITIGNGVFIGPKVNLITINHDVDPENRSATYGRPIVLEDKIWIDINVIVLPGVRKFIYNSVRININNRVKKKILKEYMLLFS